jgi:hypothetical protein
MSSRRRRPVRLARDDDYLDDDLDDDLDEGGGELDGGGGAGQLGELCGLLRRARLDLGDDVNVNNLVERLIVALRTKLAHEGGGDETGAEEIGPLAESPQEPNASAYLSLQRAGAEALDYAELQEVRAGRRGRAAQDKLDQLERLVERDARRVADRFFKCTGGAG